MAGFIEVLRNYPLLSVGFILTPLLGGIVGAYLGFDNLSTRLANERQQQRIENRQETIKEQLNGLAVPIETVRRYEQALQAQGQGLEILRRILSQYDQLRQAVAIHEQFIGKEDSQDRVATAEHTLRELQALLGTAQTVPGPGGQALIIKTAPNTFRVTFGVPMRIPPAVTFSGLPNGIEAHVVEKTNIGFTVIFTPANVPVNNFGFQASAEL
jgi:hypothetical protein